MLDHRLIVYNPHATPSNVIKNRDNTLPTWVKSNAPATMFTTNMEKPKRGTLVLNTYNEWYFHAGRGTSRAPLRIPDFHEHIFAYLKSSQITRGNPPFHQIYNSQRQEKFKEAVANHVSAASLHSKDAPTLIKLNRIKTKDKDIWKEVYDEEYYGLTDLTAWTPIAEDEYQKIRHVVGHTLPMMAL